MQSSQDLLELGRILAAAPRPWQGQDSQEGEGGGQRREQEDSRAHSEVCGGKDGAIPMACAGCSVLQCAWACVLSCSIPALQQTLS